MSVEGASAGGAVGASAGSVDQAGSTVSGGNLTSGGAVATGASAGLAGGGGADNAGGGDAASGEAGAPPGAQPPFDWVGIRLPWQPLEPTGAKRKGSTIEIAFHVPNPPLVWSPHIAPAHQKLNTEWAHGRGFEVVTNAGQSVTISTAAIEGESVVLSLKNPPAPSVPLIVRYAMTQDGELNQGGDIAGLRGQLRDSDPFVGADAETISATVTSGEAVIKSVDKGAFRRRAGYDIVSEAGVENGLVVVSRDSDEQLTLSAGWPGKSGPVSVSFRYDLYNYCVHFSLGVD
jgi:hypothetical protein